MGLFNSFVSNIFCTGQMQVSLFLFLFFPSKCWIHLKVMHEAAVYSSYYSFFSLLLQRLFANVEREKIDQEIKEKFEIVKLASSSPSNTVVLADLGCAAGPNTFGTMQHIVKSMKETFQSVCPISVLPEFQVFFNDQVVKSCIHQTHKK